jgi:hypothetical protein
MLLIFFFWVFFQEELGVRTTNLLYLVLVFHILSRRLILRFLGVLIPFSFSSSILRGVL